MNIEHIKKLELGDQCEYCFASDDSGSEEFYIMEDGSTICCDSPECRTQHYEDLIFANQIMNEAQRTEVKA